MLTRLVDLAFDQPGSTRRRTVLVGERLFENEFITLINERIKDNPEASSEILQLLGLGLSGGALTIANEISETEPGDIQKTASLQIKLLDGYYKDVLTQSNTTLRWAIVTATGSWAALIISLFILLIWNSQGPVTILTSIATVLAQFIAATQFYLYRQTTEQLAYFHQQLNQVERFLLANSLCESLDGDTRQRTRSELVKTIATFELKGSSKAARSSARAELRP